jgi:hypothetical protein
MTNKCNHPPEKLKSFAVGKIQVIYWCILCGALRSRKGVSNIENLNNSPWEEWCMPEHAYFD